MVGRLPRISVRQLHLGDAEIRISTQHRLDPLQQCPRRQGIAGLHKDHIGAARLCEPVVEGGPCAFVRGQQGFPVGWHVRVARAQCALCGFASAHNQRLEGGGGLCAQALQALIKGVRILAVPVQDHAERQCACHLHAPAASDVGVPVGVILQPVLLQEVLRGRGKTRAAVGIGDHGAALEHQAAGETGEGGAAAGPVACVELFLQGFKHVELLEHTLAVLRGDLARAPAGLEIERFGQVHDVIGARGGAVEKSVILEPCADIKAQPLDQRGAVELVPRGGEMGDHIAPVAQRITPQRDVPGKVGRAVDGGMDAACAVCGVGLDRAGHPVRAGVLQHLPHAQQIVGHDPVIAVDKGDTGAGGVVQSGVARGAEAGVVLPDQGKARIAACGLQCNVAAAVGGAVIDHQHVEVGKGLGPHAADAGGHMVCNVIDRDDHRNTRAVRGRGCHVSAARLLGVYVMGAVVS